MVNLLACHQCGGVLEIAALGAVTLLAGFATSAINYVRKKLHDRRPQSPRCKICGSEGGIDLRIDANRRCIAHRFGKNAERLW